MSKYSCEFSDDEFFAGYTGDADVLIKLPPNKSGKFQGHDADLWCADMTKPDLSAHFSLDVNAWLAQNAVTFGWSPMDLGCTSWDACEFETQGFILD